MLYNPQWESKINSYSMDGLITWLEQQPANENYSYFSYTTCLAAQFNATCGREYEVPNPFLFWRWHTFEHKLEYSVASAVPHNYGAALERARAIANK